MFANLVCIFTVLKKNKTSTINYADEITLTGLWEFAFPAAGGRRWTELTVDEQRAYVMRLLDALEVTDRDKRLKVARAILYLAQGV